MENTKRFQLDLTQRELDDLVTFMHHGNMRSKREVICEALAVYKFAASEMLNGCQIASVSKDGVITKFTTPSLSAYAAIGERMERSLPSPEELLARASRPIQPVQEKLAELNLSPGEVNNGSHQEDGVSSGSGS